MKDKRRAKMKAEKRAEREKIKQEESFVRFKCLECGIEEEIPKSVVIQMDMEDGGDPLYPPRFKCEVCPGQMEPIFYEGVHGYTYRFGEER